MHVGFQTLANHADGIANTILGIDDKFVRQTRGGLRDRPGVRQFGRHRWSRFKSSRSMSRGRGAERNAATAVDAAHMAAGNANDGGFDGHIGDAFGFFNGAANGADRGIEIDDETFAQAFGFGRAQRKKLDLIVLRTSANSAQVLVLPMSSPMRYLSFFAKAFSSNSSTLCFARKCAGVGVHHHLT